MQPIMAIWSGKIISACSKWSSPEALLYEGYDLGGDQVAANALTPYIQQAVDQINFVIGNPATNAAGTGNLVLSNIYGTEDGVAAAAIRSSMGHPEPFTLNYVEVGNEDFFAATTYAGPNNCRGVPAQ